MNYKHLSQTERYQIYSLMKPPVAIGSNWPYELALARSQDSRNVREVVPWVKREV